MVKQKTDYTAWLGAVLWLAVIFMMNDSEAREYTRSTTVRNQFILANPCPANGKTKGSCAGYVVDHIVPLACGGADNIENMQWQTVKEGKLKDLWERWDCAMWAKVQRQGLCDSKTI
jgi:hypothetical protein